MKNNLTLLTGRMYWVAKPTTLSHFKQTPITINPNAVKTAIVLGHQADNFIALQADTNHNLTKPISTAALAKFIVQSAIQTMNPLIKLVNRNIPYYSNLRWRLLLEKNYFSELQITTHSECVQMRTELNGAKCFTLD